MRTWLTCGLPCGRPDPDLTQNRPRPDPDSAKTRSRPAQGPTLTGLSTTVDRWFGGGQRWAATGDRRLLPLLTADHHRGPSPLTDGPPSLTVGPASLTVGPASLTGTDRYCAGGSWTNGRMTRVILGTVAAEQKVQYEVRKRFSTRYCSSTRSQKGQYEVRESSILEADVAQGDWWIGNLQLPMMR
nr:hypothetical protein [Tanacetum cinerariifolium]